VVAAQRAHAEVLGDQCGQGRDDPAGQFHIGVGVVVVGTTDHVGLDPSPVRSGRASW
jgi:hypothetical protein